MEDENFTANQTEEEGCDPTFCEEKASEGKFLEGDL